jgi:SAM-dependent methyltransferase
MTAPSRRQPADRQSPEAGGKMATVLHEDRVRAGSFGADAERYDRARPTYPPSLIDDLVADHPAQVLDVGCGTGIASRLLAARGCQVLGVEPDERMAAVARSHGVDVEVATIETWDSAGRRFDLLTSAQAWHWVDPLVGAAKAADVLNPDGCIGLFWNVARHSPDMQATFDAIYECLAPGLDRHAVLLGHGSAERFELAARTLPAGGRFTDVAVRAFPHARAYTTEAWLDQLPTHSDHATLEPERLEVLLAAVEAAIDEVGGHFTMEYDAWLVTARRTED